MTHDSWVQSLTKADWEKVPIDEKIKLFLKVADMISNEYRADMNATTMLGQSKTIIQVKE